MDTYLRSNQKRNMKNETTKAFCYQNLYPINLYVTDVKDWEDAYNFFDFFPNTIDLRNDKSVEVNRMNNAMAATYLVREKNTRAVGILIVLEDYRCATLAHESIHYADAVYDYLSMNAEGYNEGNEHMPTWLLGV